MPLYQLDEIRSSDIREAIKTLLESKSLYQALEIPDNTWKKGREIISGEIKASQNRPALPSLGATGNADRDRRKPDADGLYVLSGKEFSRLKDYITKQRQAELVMVGEPHDPNRPMPEHQLSSSLTKEIAPDQISIYLPTIHVPCANCKSKLPPHNPRIRTPQPNHTGVNFQVFLELWRNGDSAIYWLPYLCQSCKIKPLIFLLQRRSEKISIVGRSDFPCVEVPTSIPENEEELYSKAIIAQKTGFKLAALCYLRAFVEKYMRRVTETANDARLTGDELGEKYSKWLFESYPEFPRGFASLRKVYEELSVQIHRATEGTEADLVFEQCVALSQKHFLQLSVFTS
jgi:hypothetical protein